MTEGVQAQHEHKDGSGAATYHLVMLVLHIIDAELNEAVLVDRPIGRQTHTSQEQRISRSLPGEKKTTWSEYLCERVEES